MGSVGSVGLLAIVVSGRSLSTDISISLVSSVSSVSSVSVRTGNLSNCRLHYYISTLFVDMFVVFVAFYLGPSYLPLSEARS